MIPSQQLSRVHTAQPVAKQSQQQDVSVSMCPGIVVECAVPCSRIPTSCVKCMPPPCHYIAIRQCSRFTVFLQPIFNKQALSECLLMDDRVGCWRC